MSMPATPDQLKQAVEAALGDRIVRVSHDLGETTVVVDATNYASRCRLIA